MFWCGFVLVEEAWFFFQEFIFSQLTVLPFSRIIFWVVQQNTTLIVLGISVQKSQDYPLDDIHITFNSFFLQFITHSFLSLKDAYYSSAMSSNLKEKKRRPVSLRNAP